MPEITVEEARRRQQQARKAKAEKAPLANGHDPAIREIPVADWNSLGPPVAQDELVGGLIGQQQFGMVYGESGGGKSFSTFDMVAHYSLGREWFGRRVKGGGVLYIAAEGRGGWANRVEAFCRHHNLDPVERTMIPFGFVLEPVNLGRNGAIDAAAIIKATDKWSQKVGTAIDLLVIDTMARATPGANENDAGDMGAFVGNMDIIRRNTGASPLVVHHSGKNSALGARGHSSLRAAVDVEIEVERTSTGRRLKLRKNRDGTDSDNISFELKVIEIGTGPEGKPITSCVVVPAAPPAEESPRKKRIAKSDSLLVTVVNQALDRFGIEIQLPENGPRVKAVNAEYVRNGYVKKRSDLGYENATRTVRRAIGKALEEELLVSSEVSGTSYLFWPNKP